VETVQPVFASQGRALQVQMPDAPLWVVGDETRLVQAVVNLLTNALRFGGEAPVQLNLRAVDQQACLAVEDRGTGIEPGRLSQIFQPFYQTPQSLARTAGGLGLGLAIVKAIVEHHGGRVQVHSDGLGLGSRFEFTLPTIERPPERPAAAPARAPRRPGRVLVVDDNVDAAMTLAQVLGQAGHEVRVAATGQEGLAVARSFAPQVAVLDIGLPDLDGYALALRLRDEPATRHACLVALTGYGQSVDKARARDAGFQRHFTKPADLEHLLEAIDELVAERSEA
jgi:CheY-like chemotaxis protein